MDLRTKRQAALANAMTTPLFKERAAANEARAAAQVYLVRLRLLLQSYAINSVSLLWQDVYPFVFDSLAKTKLAAGFIQGVKMSLPTGFERKDDRD